MRGRTFALSQKELQRVSVISSCAKGDMACARAAELLSLSVRQVRRLNKRLREQGEAALAHANRGRPSPRRLPERVRQTALRLARTTYAGFNDHHLCEKLCEVEGFSLSRETLRRLLRQAGLGSPRKRRAPAHRPRLPLAVYGDHSGIFVRSDDFWSVEEQLAGKRQPTQFGRALEQLGITFIAARSPQAKGRVERLWGVLQDRLCSELRLAQAGDLDSANAVLRVFVAAFTRRFARRPREMQTAWRPAPENLDRICCFVHQRVVSNDNIVQWEGQRFQIPQQGQRFSFAGAKVQIYQALDGRVSLFYGETRLQHTLASPG